MYEYRFFGFLSSTLSNQAAWQSNSAQVSKIGFFPADHWIDPPEAFHHTLYAAIEVAQQQGAIVTLGVKPTYPSTGYGYINPCLSLISVPYNFCPVLRQNTTPFIG
nr:sugar phosphate nucleotidyltransferase [Spirulina major]